MFLMYFPITRRMAMADYLNPSDYKPDYIERDPEVCPHCAYDDPVRTNRYLYRCTNPGCGRYW